MRLPLGQALAAAILGAAAGALVQPGPAAAAACPEGSGVTVVVGSTTSCDPDGGGTAADSFRDVGHVLTPVTRQPAFVCQVDGVPDTASCTNIPPSNAYWGLFWSDGSSGSWTYASQGASTLTVPAGGWVAFVFQTSASKSPPAVVPAAGTPAVDRERRDADSGARTTPEESSGPGALGWVAAGLAVALIGGAALAWRRRRSAASS